MGGEQERARRAGLENVSGAIGFGAVAVVAGTARDPRRARRPRPGHGPTGWPRVATAVAGVDRFGDPSDRLPHIVCLGIEGVEAEPVLLGLDQAGVAAHSGSSCSSESLEPSPVLEAMGVDADRSLRLSVGWSTTEQDIEAFEGCFSRVVGELRALRA